MVALTQPSPHRQSLLVEVPSTRHFPQSADRARAQRKPRGDLTVAAALCGQAGDLQLLRRELVQNACPDAGPGGLAAGAKLQPGTLAPWRRAQPIEQLQGRPQVPAGLGASSADAAKPLAVGKLGACQLEGPAAVLVQAQRLRKVLLGVLVPGQEGPAPRGDRQRSRLGGLGRPAREPGHRLGPGQGGLAQLRPAGAHGGLDQVAGRIQRHDRMANAESAGAGARQPLRLGDPRRAATSRSDVAW